MAKSKPTKRKPPSRKNPLKPQLQPVSESVLRLLQDLEERIGLFAAGEDYRDTERFREPNLLSPNSPVPEGMRTTFAGEMDALVRLGTEASQCHAVEMSPFVVYCLPYYFYDGFNALLYVERDGELFAAWKEQELHPSGTPSHLLTATPFAELKAFVHQVTREER